MDFEKDSSNSGHGWFTVVTDVEVSICHRLSKYVDWQVEWDVKLQQRLLKGGVGETFGAGDSISLKHSGKEKILADGKQKFPPHYV
mgnify:CR=1 FL=1